MKQENKATLVFPKALPKTLLGAYRWHQKLLRDCLFFEFKKMAIKKSIESIDGQLKILIQSMKKDEAYKSVIPLALGELNRLKADLEDELMATKEVTKIIHDTNEFLIGNLVSACGHKALIEQLKAKPQLRSTNLLHGLGWVFELEAVQHLEKAGKVGFLTFGTMFDPAGFDIIAFEKPLRRLKWKKGVLDKMFKIGKN